MPVDTKQRIARAYSELSTECGEEHIAVKEVLARAGVSRATFYYHFRNVDDVIQYLMDGFISEYERRIIATSRRLPPEWDDKISRMSEELRGFYGFVYDNRATYVTLANSSYGDYFRHRLTNIFRKAFQKTDWVYKQANEQFRRLTATDKDYYAYSVAYSLVGLIDCWMAKGFEEGPDAFLRRAAMILNLSYDKPYIE